MIQNNSRTRCHPSILHTPRLVAFLPVTVALTFQPDSLTPRRIVTRLHDYESGT